MLRAGLEFFTFCPRQGEMLEAVIHRFQEQIDLANRRANLGISVPFQAWMLNWFFCQDTDTDIA